MLVGSGVLACDQLFLNVDLKLECTPCLNPDCVCMCVDSVGARVPHAFVSGSPVMSESLFFISFYCLLGLA